MRVEYVAAANPNKIRVTKLIGPDADWRDWLKRSHLEILAKTTYKIDGFGKFYFYFAHFNGANKKQISVYYRVPNKRNSNRED